MYDFFIIHHFDLHVLNIHHVTRNFDCHCHFDILMLFISHDCFTVVLIPCNKVIMNTSDPTNVEEMKEKIRILSLTVSKLLAERNNLRKSNRHQREIIVSTKKRILKQETEFTIKTIELSNHIKKLQSEIDNMFGSAEAPDFVFPSEQIVSSEKTVEKTIENTICFTPPDVSMDNKVSERNYFRYHPQT